MTGPNFFFYMNFINVTDDLSYSVIYHHGA